eukprot:986833-Rhodomonas_salina.3
MSARPGPACGLAGRRERGCRVAARRAVRYLRSASCTALVAYERACTRCSELVLVRGTTAGTIQELRSTRLGTESMLLPSGMSPGSNAPYSVSVPRLYQPPVGSYDPRCTWYGLKGLEQVCGTERVVGPRA